MNFIEIFDTTLRDGEQSPSVALDLKEKIEIAYALEKLGVDVIEAGFPISNEEDYKSVREISKRIKKCGVCGLARAVEKDIQVCYDAIKYSEKPRIHTFIATSKIHMEKKLKKSEEEVLDIAKNSVKYARSLCPEIEFSLEDATRTEYPFMIKVIETAILSGAKIINVPDTVGYALPLEIENRIRYIFNSLGDLINEKGVKISVHCHNDLGNAVSNSLAGIDAGALQVEGTINGFGERAGNASLEEVVMNLKTRNDYYKKSTRINTKLLCPTSKLVSDLTGLLIQKNKPIVGENVFAHESGIHQAGIIASRDTYEIMGSEDVGWVGEHIVLGKHSGKNAIKKILTDNGIDADKNKISFILDKVKECCEIKKPLTSKEILEMIKT